MPHNHGSDDVYSDHSLNAARGNDDRGDWDDHHDGDSVDLERPSDDDLRQHANDHGWSTDSDAVGAFADGFKHGIAYASARLRAALEAAHYTPL